MFIDRNCKYYFANLDSCLNSFCFNKQTSLFLDVINTIFQLVHISAFTRKIEKNLFLQKIASAKDSH